MSSTLKEIAFYIYLILLIVGSLFLILSVNYLFVGNTTLETYSFGTNALGNWNDWIFVLSLFIVSVFGYYVYEWINDDRFFMKNINSDSKSHFLKNLKKLEKIARNHGLLYSQMLLEKKNTWKIK